MKLALDIHHAGDGAQAAAVAFETWEAAEAERTFTQALAQIGKPERGVLDLRDLAVYLQLIHRFELRPEIIAIAGFVHLDAQETPGLGWHLHHALGGTVPVIGISKMAMASTPAQFEVMREDETRPLVVTCIGIDLGAAKARLRAMHGRKRIPTLMKLAARLAKAPAG